LGPTFGLINQEIGAGMPWTTLAFSFFYFVFTRAKGQGVWLHTRLTEQINTFYIENNGKEEGKNKPHGIGLELKYQSEFVALNIYRERDGETDTAVCYVYICIHIS